MTQQNLAMTTEVTALSVNVNKIAVLRHSRGGSEPNVLRAAQTCLEAGAQGITVHPRPDQRHIVAADVYALSALTSQLHAELNIEGNPFAPPRAGYPGLLALCEKTRPTQVTLVPDADGQITSDHGFDFTGDLGPLPDLITQFKALGCRVSLFVDAGCEGLERAAQMGVDRVEIYTGPYAQHVAQGNLKAGIAPCKATAQEAQRLGLMVNAGHDLSQDNLGAFLRDVPNVQEVSIGHALIGEALYDGLETTIHRYLSIISSTLRAHRG